MQIFAQIQLAILFTIKVVALFEGDPNGIGKAWYPLYEGGFAKGVLNKYEEEIMFIKHGAYNPTVGNEQNA